MRECRDCGGAIEPGEQWTRTRLALPEGMPWEREHCHFCGPCAESLARAGWGYGRIFARYVTGARRQLDWCENARRCE